MGGNVEAGNVVGNVLGGKLVPVPAIEIKK